MIGRIRSAIASFQRLDDRRLRLIEREVRSIGRCVGAASFGQHVDTRTPRLPILRKDPDNPIITPAGNGWLAGAVFDARPLLFQGRNLIYFCAQPVYRTDAPLLVGRAEKIDGAWRVDEAPVIFPDVERRGIDVPAFTVWRDEIVGLYADDYGPDRTGLGYDTVLWLVRSSDGRSFTKSRLATPFAARDWSRIGLPWLLSAGDCIDVYWRGKNASGDLVVVSRLARDLSSIERSSIVTHHVSRNPINVAVTVRAGMYLMFYGDSFGGGLYVAPSRDGVRWEFDREIMLVGTEGTEWGWDVRKLCASPDNTTRSSVDLCYLGSNMNAMAIGHARLDCTDLLAHWEMDGHVGLTTPSPP